VTVYLSDGDEPAIYLRYNYGKGAFAQRSRNLRAFARLADGRSLDEGVDGLPETNQRDLYRLLPIHPTAVGPPDEFAASLAPRTLFLRAEKRSGYELPCPAGHRPRVKASTLIRKATEADDRGESSFCV
jgi:hypothetical protein